MTERKCKTILVIDDSKLARLIINGIFTACYPHWKVIEAEDVADALEKCKGAAFDAVSLDVNMPGQDGLTFAPRLKEMYPEVPIALLTANIQPKVQERAKELALFFIPKPITKDKLTHFMQSFGESGC